MCVAFSLYLYIVENKETRLKHHTRIYMDDEVSEDVKYI